ncbi:MAG: tRNA lysidine(34) synthetase TilS [Alphaproteobacteria bacterium]|nr:tRNA lysidine(34) synthetase TilS [Alphaproteobacteria bacterium]MCL2890146.1 tRNA lysidine(34) synthetase TilS [Alphaproteobacteria bacterium]
MRKYTNQRMAVAVSGGVDSMVLMNLCASAGLGAVVLHVDHGLRATSGADSEFVAAAAAKLGLPCTILNWTGDKPKTGIEAAARDARYKLLTDYCRDNDIDVLLVAHQADDQIETFLMNLGRGSGVYGLAAMRAEQIRDGVVIARPLLSIARAELEEYARARNIKSVNDEMNIDGKFTRVKTRKNRHVLADSLDISDSRILTAIDALGRVRDMLESDVNHLIDLVYVASGRALFSAKFLFDMPEEIRLKFIAELVRRIGQLTYAPRLEKIRRAIIMLHGDAKFTVGHCTVRRLDNKILIVPEGVSTSFRKEKNV